MALTPRLDSETAAANMAEIEPAYTPQQALVEANRCLFCFDAPCISACPTGIDIPGFIKKIASENATGAGNLILRANILGASCARVCPTAVLCEGACVLEDRDKNPIKIGRLQRYATDRVYEDGPPKPYAPGPSSGKRVALIGSGPASLGCAAELARLGHAAVVFEKKPQPGGLNTYGIAYYKLRPETSLEEIELVKSLGVEFRCGVEVGKDLPADQLLEDFDAVFIGIGLGSTRALGIPGEDLPGVCEALEFIENVRTQALHEVPVGGKVAVIGCGNTAIDAVTQAKRLGADSATIIYRRGEGDMPAYAYEYELAKTDGCDFLFHAMPVEVLGDNAVTGLRLIRTRENGTSGLEPVPGSEFVVDCDMVIKASGQEKQRQLLQNMFPNLTLDQQGRIKADPGTGRTDMARVFAGGDAVNGGREVVNAVAEGVKAARGIHESLGGSPVDGPVQPTRLGATTGPVGAGFDHPVRVPELEHAFHTSQGA